jgi:hypothetical protein
MATWSVLTPQRCVGAQSARDENRSDNQRAATVRFCGWGAELSAGSSVQLGVHHAAWGSSICLTDADFVSPPPVYDCSGEGACRVLDSGSRYVNFSYVESNLGPQAAEVSGRVFWSSAWLFDGDTVLVDRQRESLAPGTSRKVVPPRAKVGLRYDNMSPIDFDPHVLSLHLDSDNELRWVRSDYAPPSYNLTIRFCMQEQLDRFDRCGCSGAQPCRPTPCALHTRVCAHGAQHCGARAEREMPDAQSRIWSPWAACAWAPRTTRGGRRHA